MWQLAYGDDDDPGESTYLAVDDFSVTSYGAQAAPSIEWSGLDVTGTLGYESHRATTEAISLTSSGGDIGSPLAGNYTSIPEPGAITLIGLAVGIWAAARRSAVTPKLVLDWI